MATKKRSGRRVLIDTSALIALSHSRDQNHVRAVMAARRHARSGGRYAGTALILGELYSHLLYLRGPEAARTALSHLLADPVHEWLEVDVDLIRAAVDNWLARYADQAFSLVDAVSFELMRRERLGHAFAYDRHFEVAGFELIQ